MLKDFFLDIIEIIIYRLIDVFTYIVIITINAILYYKACRYYRHLSLLLFLPLLSFFLSMFLSPSLLRSCSLSFFHFCISLFLFNSSWVFPFLKNLRV